ncbi:MAG: TIGR01458 family HAD-type hydrolase [Candidatus Lokiarchaeota archaeon]|nr:TIGR01458 family HAD-type hydrolase [Candidatus Lokiarchaeota archaeon]
MEEIKAFMIDLGGVIYIDNNLIKGAKETLAFLKDNNYKYLFMSNTTQKRRKNISKKLLKMGIEIQEKEIFTPPIAAIKKLNKENKKRCYLFSTGDIHEEFQEKKIILTDQKVDYVIVGDAAQQFNFKNMNKAFRLLLKEQTCLMALEKDKYYMGSDKKLMLSAGPFVSALEFATDKKAIIIGKPSREFFELGLKELGGNLNPQDVAMVGDDIFSDVGGAKQCGMKGILVKTGKYREELINNSKIKADIFIDSIADLPDINF